MIAHLEGLIKTNNFVPHQFCSKTNITPPGAKKMNLPEIAPFDLGFSTPGGVIFILEQN